MQNCNMPECSMPNQRMFHEIDGFMSKKDVSCGCGEYPIGMAYVPWQKFKDIYDLERGLHAGTIFSELEKPFLGRRAFKR